MRPPARRPLPLLFAQVLLALAVAPVVATSAPGPSQLTNIYLAPEHARWMVGSIYQLASPEEVERWLALRSDEAAEEFIAEFWARRDPNPAREGNEFREEYERRAGRADVVYRDGTTPGRQTEKGAIHILFGEPAETKILTPTNVDNPPIEVWSYPRDRQSLDGRPVREDYAFVIRENGRVELLRPLQKPEGLPLDPPGFVF